MMNSSPDPEGSSYLAEQVLTSGFVKSLQIFYFAFGIGAILLLLVVLFQSLSVVDVPVTVDDTVVRMLTVVHLVYGLAGYVLAPMLFRRILSRGLSSRRVQRLTRALRNAYIYRLVLLEGIAFFGLVILLISSFDGVLTLFPQYWMNIVSTLVLLVFVPSTFPTRERLRLLIQG